MYSFTIGKYQSGLMVASSSLWMRLLLLGTFLAVFGGEQVRAQGAAGQSPQSTDERQRRVPNQGQSFIHGVSVAVGLAIYQGDFSLNPNHNLVKYIAGNGSLAARVGIDHRLGRFDQYGLGADLVYNRLTGESVNGTGFKANSLALDFYADYELPYIREGLFRVFLGGGPNLIISPSYTGNPAVVEDDDFQPLGTRVIGSLKVGVTIMDSFRIGTRIASNDLLDGYKGFQAQDAPDFVSSLSIGYRFDVR